MYTNIVTHPVRLQLFNEKRLNVDVIRLDLIDRDISGNKWFKLKHHLALVQQQRLPGMVSFGGAFSNHLVALAALCHRHRLQSAGIVRGEAREDNHSIRLMKQFGMELVFLSRAEYREKEAWLMSSGRFAGLYTVPEGGMGDEGIRGAGEILSGVTRRYTHIICAVGTGTTLCGLVKASSEEVRVIGVPAFRIPAGTDNTITKYLADHGVHAGYVLAQQYHFGGFGKAPAELLQFMNNLYAETNIPTDIVYTGKLFYAVQDLAIAGEFEPGSSLLIIHSGGLQGNKSLPPGVLHYGS